MDWPSRDADLAELALSEWGEWSKENAGGPPQEYLEDLIASWVQRKRWEYREQAIASLSVQAEAMGVSSKSKPAKSGRVFKPNNGGINQGPPPLAVLKDMGFDVEM